MNQSCFRIQGYTRCADRPDPCGGRITRAYSPTSRSRTAFATAALPLCTWSLA